MSEENGILMKNGELCKRKSEMQKIVFKNSVKRIKIITFSKGTMLQNFCEDFFFNLSLTLIRWAEDVYVLVLFEG